MIANGMARAQQRMRADRRRWFRMLGCSLLVHGALVLIAAAWSGVFAAKPRYGPVYSVELVSLPAAKARSQTTLLTRRQSKEAWQRQAIPLKRFRAKREALTLKKRQGLILPSKGDEPEALKESLAKLERRPTPSPAPAAEKVSGEPSRAVVGKKKVSLVNIGGMKGEELSRALGLYRALVYEKIESNWVLPERLIPEKAKPEAVVVVRARRDGTVTDIRFEKNSGDPYFDDSVFKAILKSKPFPPFPDIYSPKEEEIVIRFSPANERS